MAEVVAAVQAATQLLEQAFRLLGRLRRAHERQKALPAILQRHEDELNSVKTIIGIIDDEEELQTANVTSELLRLKEVQSKLVKLLEALVPKSKNKASQLARQLAQGSSDERKLVDILSELGQIKAALLLLIQVASVGVVRDMEKRLVANAEVIERIDQFLKEELGDCEGLKIAQLLKGRHPSNDGTVPLTLADIRSLGGDDETLLDDCDSSSNSTSGEQAKTERIILRNAAKHRALQINGALGDDIWKGIDRLVIKDNIAEDESIQVNHSISIEAFLLMQGCQEKKIAMAQQKP